MAAAKNPKVSMALFNRYALAFGLPVPQPEYRFAPPRKWRFDYAWLAAKVALEIQGGLFTAGRHVQGAALLREYEKLNEAVILKWRVLLVTPQQVNSGEAFALVKRALESP